MAIDLYMMEISAPCRAVLMTAKIIGLDLNKKHVNVLKQEQLSSEFLKINPQHCLPTIDDNGFILWESRAIMKYLVNQYAPGNDLYPADPKKQAIIDRFLYFDIGTFYNSLTDYVQTRVFRGERKDPHKEDALKSSMQILEDSLQKNSYVAGDKMTIADISIMASIGVAKIFAEAVDLDFNTFPHIQAWEERVKGRIPFYKEINEAGNSDLQSIVEMKKAQAQGK